MSVNVNEPAWSGISYVIGGDTHIMPLHENDKQHTMDADCVCGPTITAVHGQHAKEPMRRLFHHAPVLVP